MSFSYTEDRELVLLGELNMHWLAVSSLEYVPHEVQGPCAVPQYICGILVSPPTIKATQ